MGTLKKPLANVHIGENIARFGNVTYNIDNIGSVTLKKEPNGFSVSLWVVIVFLFFLLWVNVGFIIAAVLLVAAGIGVSALKLPQGATLSFKNSSGDIEIFKHPDAEYVAGVRAALESALEKRGKLNRIQEPSSR